MLSDAFRTDQAEACYDSPEEPAAAACDVFVRLNPLAFRARSGSWTGVRVSSVVRSGEAARRWADERLLTSDGV